MAIKIKRSAVAGKVPTTAQLDLGELAVNTYDGKLYTKKNDGADAVVEMARASDVAGKAALTGATFTGNVSAPNFTTTSDARAKSDITPLTGALDKVLALRGVSFTLHSDGQRQIGLIAQETRKIIPEVVRGEDMLSLAYGNIVGLLVEAIRDLNAEIDALRETLKC